MQSAHDYRSYLKAALVHRIRQNPRYSLRAFARDLSLPASRLSQVLRGKQGLSEVVALRITRALRLDEKEKQRFCLMVRASDSRSKRAREGAAEELKAFGPSMDAAFKLLQADHFALIADWWHAAILELFQTAGARFEAVWVADRLGITLDEATEALARLQRLNLIANQRGRPVPPTERWRTNAEVPSEAARRSHRQLLERAIPALHQQEVHERHFSSVLFPVHPSEIPALKERVRAFVYQLGEELGRPAKLPRTEVYNFGLQLFRLTQSPDPQESP